MSYGLGVGVQPPPLPPLNSQNLSFSLIRACAQLRHSLAHSLYQSLFSLSTFLSHSLGTGKINDFVLEGGGEVLEAHTGASTGPNIEAVCHSSLFEEVTYFYLIHLLISLMQEKY